MYDAPLTVPTILLVLVLVVSGVAKLFNLSTAADAFVSLRLPPVLQRLKAPQILPFGELTLAALLLVTRGWFAVLVASAALVLFIGYLVVIVRALGFGEKVTCSCFGKLGLGTVDRFTACRNAILVALAGVALYDATRGRSVLGRLTDFSRAEWMWLAGVFAAVALTWLIAGHRGGDATAAAAPAVDDDGEYLRVPIPFVTLRTPTDQPMTLREMARTEPVLLLIVSPTCGSCRDVIERARTWQHTVPQLRTVLVLPTPVAPGRTGLVDESDFDILYDPDYSTTRLFEGGTPTAVLLGADGKLAGGPVVGGAQILPFLDDIAAELAGVGESTPADDEPSSETSAMTTTPTTDAEPSSTPTAAVDGTVDEATTLADGSGAGRDDALADYLEQATPFVLFTNADGDTVALRTIGAAGPAVLLYVSPTCGSCVQVMDEAPDWRSRLLGVPIYYVVVAETQMPLVVERGVEPQYVLHDENMALSHMMGIGTPSMFAVGPSQNLLAGPVSGAPAIATAMEEIIAEVAAVRGDVDGSIETPADDSPAPQTPQLATEPSPRQPLPDAAVERADGAQITVAEALGGRRSLVVFLSPGCEACHDVAARIPAWRDQLPQWQIATMVPTSAADHDPSAYSPGTTPDLFDATLEFGAALGIETPAVLVVDESGTLIREPAVAQEAIYPLIRELRAEG